MNKDEKIIIDAFNKAPEKTQNFIESPEYISIVSNLGSRYSLTGEESYEIQIQTLNYLLNLGDKKQTKENIVLALRDRSAANIEQIIKEIEKKILTHR